MNIHLLTFEPWKSDSILIRFEHILAVNEDKQYSQNVTFNLSDVFRSLNIVDVRETTLAGNQWLNEAKRFKFTATKDDLNQVSESSETTEETEARNNTITKKNKRSINPKPDVSPRQYHLYRAQYKRYRSEESDEDKFVVTLKPMEIRTFIIDLDSKI